MWLDREGGPDTESGEECRLSTIGNGTSPEPLRWGLMCEQVRAGKAGASTSNEKT